MAKKKAKRAANRTSRKAPRKAAKRAVRRTKRVARKASAAPRRKPAARPAASPASPRVSPAPAAQQAAAPPAKAEPKTGAAALPAEKQIAGGVFLGSVEDFFSHVQVMALKLQAPVSVGDMIRIKGHTTDITQKVESMQVEHQPVQAASTGDSVGIKIADRSRKGDAVYKI